MERSDYFLELYCGLPQGEPGVDGSTRRAFGDRIEPVRNETSQHRAESELCQNYLPPLGNNEKMTTV